MAGALALADLQDETIRLACRKCEQRGQYRRSSLMAFYGNKTALPDVLAKIVYDCPKRGARGYDARGADFPDVFGRLITG